MSEVRNIPKHWQVKKLGEVCTLKNGYAFKSSLYQGEGVPVIRISDINGGIVSSGKAVRVKLIDEYENYLVENNDILVAMSGATTGKFGIYKSSEKAFQNQRVGKFKILNKDILDNQFLYHQINSLKRQIEKDAYGGAQPNISSNKIEQMQIVVPPLLEQQLIVSKIEELLSDLDNGKQQLQIAQQQLKVYRQSLLKWAFEGKLTNKNVKEGELPKGWKTMKLKDITLEKEGLRRGPFGSAIKKEFFVPEGYKVYEQGNAINNDPYRGRYFIDEKKYNELINFKVLPSDLIVSCSGVTLGRICNLPDDTEPGIINQALLRIRLKKDLILNKYFVYHFRGAFFQKKIFDQSQGTAMPNLVGIKDFKEIEMLVPPITEQIVVIQELESKLTVCDKIEEAISQSLLQAETLRQSILKKAFEGKLVSLNYDSDDKLDKHEMGLAAEKQVPYKTSS